MTTEMAVAGPGSWVAGEYRGNAAACASDSRLTPKRGVEFGG